MPRYPLDSDQDPRTDRPKPNRSTLVIALGTAVIAGLLILASLSPAPENPRRAEAPISSETAPADRTVPDSARTGEAAQSQSPVQR